MSAFPPTDNKTALLIIDLQKGFINGHTAHLPPLIESLQAHYGTVIATRFHNRPASAFRRLMGWPRFGPHTDETALALTPAENAAIIEKDTYNCITPALLDILANNNIDTVHIAGCDTNMCVYISAAALFDTHAYRPVIVAGYCASHSGPAYHEAGIMLLEKAIGREQIWSGLS